MTRRILLAAALIVAAATTRAAPGATDEGRLYITPLWNDLPFVTTAVVQQEAARLRARIGEGGPVRIGFARYSPVIMGNWPVASEAEALASLADSIASMDASLQAARAAGVPIVLLFLTPIREAVDYAQDQSQSEDVRVAQWYDDHTLADGWWTYSRYAREQYAIRERYVRALGRAVANRMALYPDTFIAAAGDGEIELAFDGNQTIQTPPLPLKFADYSPFSVAEFRDWLRGTGLYAPGQAFAADAYALAGRYRTDLSPATDTSGDGRTLNGDFLTSFTSWDLRFEPWSLDDGVGTGSDGHQIPEATYFEPGWTPADHGVGRFDAPRTKGADPGNQWWALWFQFRVAQVGRHNQDFAKWMTTSADPATGLTVPPSRWYSYQIPADYLFEHTPQAPDLRYLTSASSWSTADIRPFGGAGITAFNTFDGVRHARTLFAVAPLLAGLGSRWGIFEWNPSVPATTDPAIYRAEMALVERYRPTIVTPFLWDSPDFGILDTGFETALAEMVNRMRRAPWNLRADVTGAQVRFTWAAPDAGVPAPNQYRFEVDATPDGQRIVTLDTNSRSTILNATGPPGTYYIRVRALRGADVSSTSNLVRVVIGAAGAPEAPSHLAAVTTGSTMTFNWLAPKSGPAPAAYVIEAGSAPGQANLAVLDLPAATTFSIANVPGGTYHVRVRARTASGTGPPTNDVVVSSAAGGGHCTPVQPPGTLAFTLAGRVVTFAWDGPAYGATPAGYQLEARLAPDLPNIAVLPLGPARAFSVSAPPGTFYLRLRAVNACGTSPPGPDTRLDVP